MNICGTSEHSKTAVEKFLDEKRTYFVCLNETQKKMSSDFFNNFHTEDSQSSNSGGVALQLTKRSFIQESMTSNAQIYTASWFWDFSENSNFW